jgi:hypothetical protein
MNSYTFGVSKIFGENKDRFHRGSGRSTENAYSSHTPDTNNTHVPLVFPEVRVDSGLEVIILFEYIFHTQTPSTEIILMSYTYV